MGGKGRGQACGTWNKHAGPAAVCGLPKSASPGHLRLNSQQMCQDSATRFSLRVLGILLWKPQPCAENSPHCFLSPEVRNGCYIKVMGLSSQLPLFPLISCWPPRLSSRPGRLWHHRPSQLPRHGMSSLWECRGTARHLRVPLCTAR